MTAAAFTTIGLIFKAAQFAADKHRSRRRKESEASSYINHPISLANVRGWRNERKK